MIQAEKVLYYTLEKINMKYKLHSQAEFFFADAIDTLLSSDLSSVIANSSLNKSAFIYVLGEKQILLMIEKEKSLFKV